MPINRSFLRHEIQNILMILGFSLEEIKMENKENMLSLIKLVSLFVEQEDLFLGKKPKFYIQNILLSDVFEIMVGSNEELIKSRKTEIKVNNSDFELKIDRDYTLKALNQVLSRILEQASFVELGFNEKENAIVLLHDGGLVVFEKKPLESLLKSKKNNYKEIIFQVSLHILDSFGCVLEVNKNEVIIVFPK